MKKGLRRRKREAGVAKGAQSAPFATPASFPVQKRNCRGAGAPLVFYTLGDMYCRGRQKDWGKSTTVQGDNCPLGTSDRPLLSLVAIRPEAEPCSAGAARFRLRPQILVVQFRSRE